MDDPATGPVARWWERHAADLSDPLVAARVVRAALADGVLDLPAPGGGRTAARWSVLAALAAADVTLAKLGEAHADAVAILDELSGPAPGADLWAVWAARPATLTAELLIADPPPPDFPGARPPTPEPPVPRAAAPPAASGAGEWRLTGTKPFASGYGCCGRALVTATAPDGERLFVLDPADPGVVADEDSWPALAMSGTRSVTLRLTGVRGTAVGAAGAYTGRPGFWWGGAGIAACWYGGAAGVARPLRERVAASPAEPYRAAHLGAVDALLAATAATLDAAATAIDRAAARVGGLGEQAADGFVVAMTARVVAEHAATTVLDRVGRALGPGPLVGDRAHARRVADLGLFLRQSHAEADLADLGRRTAAAGGPRAW